MCAALTTNVTKFFREDHHFGHLRSQVLPRLLAAARAGGKVRIWSAGCSSGQEPYSVALTILSLMPEARSYDIRILATDINPHVLEVGKAGLYPEDEMSDVEPALRNKWMERVSVKGVPHFQLDEAVLGLVTFRQLNLMGRWPMRGPFQAIFCRNVVIYFDDATQARMWSRILPLLDQNGFLYIGHSERISGQATSQTNCEGTTTYRKAMRAVA
jgi:chemotaxis protein methyltransferase CheR